MGVGAILGGQWVGTDRSISQIGVPEVLPRGDLIWDGVPDSGWDTRKWRGYQVGDGVPGRDRIPESGWDIR